MPDTYQSYRTFIASPSDIAKEREFAEATIARLNRTLRDTLKLFIDVRKWEHEVPLAPNLPEERLQDRLLREVEQSHFFILILYRRYGTIEPGHSVSNTEREINAILDGYAKGRRRQVLAYFRELPQNSDPGKQEVKVRQLRERLSELGLAWRPYRTPAEFNEHLAHDLYEEVVLKIRLSPFKQQALNSFWRFGGSGRPHVPRVAVVFPPYDRESLRAGKQASFWLQRFAAPIAFEDHKAIRKFEKHFQLSGLQDYRLYPHTDTPPQLEFANRVWICVPRNRLALRTLAARMP